ncbi:MAG TPA: nitrous oxide-stimulated promoter family protein [Woeseiaceae bacterium]
MGLRGSRTRRERETIGKMVGIYCAAHHQRVGRDLCEPCAEFLQYAERRLQKCPYGVDKPTCANCPIHCYKPDRRERAREIMRFAGPRMLLRHPLLAILHQWDGLRKAGHPRELMRAQRLGARRESSSDARPE